MEKDLRGLEQGPKAKIHLVSLRAILKNQRQKNQQC